MDLQPIHYEAGGNAYTGFLADGSNGARVPGMLVIHEAGGLTEHSKSRAMRLAEMGNVAFAMNLFGPEIEVATPGRPEAMAKAQAVVRQLRGDLAEFRSRVQAALSVLAGHANVDPARLAAIGYCLGGAAAVELARTGAPLKLIAGFHSGILPGKAEDNRLIRGKVLLCHGADDPVVPLTEIKAFCGELSAAGIDWQLHSYGGVGHSFTNPAIDAFGLPGFFHQEAADRRSWAALCDLIEETL
jgi:dienelactone hydrolase